MNPLENHFKATAKPLQNQCKPKKTPISEIVWVIGEFWASFPATSPHLHITSCCAQLLHREQYIHGETDRIHHQINVFSDNIWVELQYKGVRKHCVCHGNDYKLHMLTIQCYDRILKPSPLVTFISHKFWYTWATLAHLKTIMEHNKTNKRYAWKFENYAPNTARTHSLNCIPRDQ